MAGCREFFLPMWPGIISRILVCEMSNDVPAAIEAPVVYHQERTPYRYPLLPFSHQFQGTVISPQTQLRGVYGAEAAAVEARRQRTLSLGG